MVLPGLVNIPQSRSDFKKYCLRRLGAPANAVNVTNEQIEDRINDAFLYFWDYHFEGTEKMYFKYQLQPADFDNKYITLPENIIGAVRIWESGDAFNSTNMFNFRYQFTLNDLYPLSTGSILTYWMTMQHLTYLEELFVGKQPIRYNRYDNRLNIDTDWTRYTVGDFLIVEAYNIIDPTVFAKVWCDRWLARYATALIKRQWGENLKLYQDIPMIGGIKFNGQLIYDEAIKEIDQLEHEMIHDYGLPAADQIG